MTGDERKKLAAKAKRAHCDLAAVLVEPGTVLHSLFIVGSGVVSLTRALSGVGEIELWRLGPGDHFGEIGMLTGAGAQATLRALTPVTTYELAKEDLAPVLEARPDVSQGLCRALARRQAAGQLLALARDRKPAAEQRRQLVFRPPAPAVRSRRRPMSALPRAVIGLAIWYLVKPEPLLVQGEAEARGSTSRRGSSAG